MANNKSRIKLHLGRALQMVADRYPTLFLAILEAIQNAIDAEPTQVWVKINFRTRSVIVQDNGAGVSRADFDEALQQILVSRKAKGKLGRFGMGLVAGFGKCKSFAFTSCAEPNLNGYTMWKFDETVLEQQDAAEVPFKHQTFRFDPKAENVAGKNHVPWRSMMQYTDFTNDAVMSRVNLNSLAQVVLGRYGTAMAQHGTAVHISLTDADGKVEQRTVTAEDFLGTPLSEIEVTKKGYGMTKFRLFIAPRISGKRKGKVYLIQRGDVYRLSVGEMVKSKSSRQWIDEELLTALLSGFFEGEIVGDIELHPERTRFVENDAWLGFVDTLADWWRQTGSKVYEEAKTEDKAERNAQVGMDSLAQIERLVSDSEYSDVLRRVIETFKFGTVGDGHADVPRKSHGEIEASKAKAKSAAPSGSGGHSNDKPEREKKTHTPFFVSRESGGKRQLVKSNSLGLGLEFDELPGARLPWELDTTYGIVRVNIRHPLWGRCEQAERFLNAYIVKVALFALVCASATEDLRPALETSYEALLGLQVDHMLAEDRWLKKAKK